MSDVIAQSPAGAIERIPDLKKRQRSIYYRPVEKNGSVEWQPTQLLPSDATGRELYFSKGFRLSIPNPTEEVERDLLAEVTSLKQQLNMAKAREAKKKE
jgi:hypothetical protein